jgi:hypothetical protein
VTNREAMLEKLADLDAEHAKAVAGGGPKYVDRHHDRGKLMPRERIELLIDEGSAFLELSPLAGLGLGLHGRASVVTGIGVIEGVECLITANDPSVKGGASNPWTVKKIFRASQIAEENGLPTVALVESGGADLPTQKEIFIPGGRLFRDITRSSAAKLPTVALVFGNSTAGGAYVPGMSDYTVMVKQQAKVFLGGPPLVKMATGEESTTSRSAAPEMHARVSGLADYLAEDERDAIRIGRRIVARLNWRKPYAARSRPARPTMGRAGRRSRAAARRHPHDLKEPFDPREVIARICDGVSPTNGVAVRRVQAALRLLTRHRLGQAPRPADRHPGQRAGRAVQRGGAEGDAVHPARQPGRHPAAVPAQHHRLHGRRRVRTGRDHQARRDDDQRGVQLPRAAPQRDHGRVVRRRELRHERPRVRPRFLFTWPSAKSAVMGPAQLAGVLSIVARAAAEARGRSTTRRPTRGCASSSRPRSRSSRCRSSSPGCSTTTASSTPRHPHDPGHLPVGDREQAFEGTDRFGVFRP